MNTLTAKYQLNTSETQKKTNNDNVPEVTPKKAKATESIRAKAEEDKMDISPSNSRSKDIPSNTLSDRKEALEENDLFNKEHSNAKSDLSIDTFPIVGSASKTITYDSRKAFGARLAKAIFAYYKISKDEAQNNAALTERKILENFGESEKNYRLAFKTLYNRIKDGHLSYDELRTLQATVDKIFIQNLIFPKNIRT